MEMGCQFCGDMIISYLNQEDLIQMEMLYKQLDIGDWDSMRIGVSLE